MGFSSHKQAKSHKKTWTWQRKGNLKIENESLLIAAQKYDITTNYVKGKIHKTQQNNKCWLCGDRDKMIDHIISECSNLGQKEYTTRHDWMGKVIHKELCKKFNFDYTNKCYIRNPESVPENEAHKLLGLWDTNRSPNLDHTTRSSDCK